MKKRRIKKWPLFVLFLMICGIFGTLYGFSGYFEKNNDTDGPQKLEKEENKEIKYSTSFTLGGNVLVNSNMWYDTMLADGKYEFNDVVVSLNDIMKKSSINFYAQQSIVGGSNLGLSMYYDYNSPTDVVDAMNDIGFNMISLASYHSYDRGLTGITNSINYLNSKEIVHSGVSDSSENKTNSNIVVKNGIKVGLLSYTIGTDESVLESYSVNIYSDDKVKSDVETIKKDVDVIMVSIDWSNIKTSEVTDEQKRIAKHLSDMGVNILVGNTGYTIQPIEFVGDMLTCYSLGNLLSGHVAVDSRISAMLDFNLVLTKSTEGTKISFEDMNVLLTYAYNSFNTQYKIIPFTKLSTELTDYKFYYDKYKTMLVTSNDKIKIYPIGE